MSGNRPIASFLRLRAMAQFHPKATGVCEAIEEMVSAAADAIARVESELPADFPEAVHMSVKDALTDRLCGLSGFH